MFPTIVYSSYIVRGRQTHRLEQGSFREEIYTRVLNLWSKRERKKKGLQKGRKNRCRKTWGATSRGT